MLLRIISAIVLFMVTQSVFAIDPVKWSLNRTFPSEVSVPGGVYTVTYTFTSQLPFTMVNPFQIEKLASPADEFSYEDGCSGIKLAPQQTCQVTILLDPLVTGQKSIQLVMTGYDNNRVPLPVLLTEARSQAGHANIVASVVKALPNSMTVNSSEIYVFRFTNSGTDTATSVTTSSNNNSFSSNCGATLAPGASCEISGTFTPRATTPATQTVTGTLSHAQNLETTASTSTTVIPATGLTGVISGLPAITVVGGSYQVTYTFTNNNTSDMTITTNTPQADVGVDCPKTPGCTYLAQANTCPVVTGVLPAGQSCQMTGLFRPDAPGSFGPFTSTLAAAAASPGPTSATLSTSTTTVAAGGARTVNFVNQCNFKVWFSMNGGAIGDSPNCTVDADCPNGTGCDPAANGGLGLCFWINPTPGPHPSNNPSNPYELEALGGVNTNSVIVPVASNGVDVNTQWSGNIAASALCNGSTSCQIADCNNKGGTDSCAVGTGFGQPATQFEITMIKNDRDFYDVEVINGFHMPIQVTPISPFAVPGDDFNCGTPGNPAPTPGFGACNWNNAAPPAPQHAYYWVSSGPSCISSSCTGGKLCGLDDKLDRVCGDFKGFWSADQACGVNADKAQQYFQCKNYLSNPPYPAQTYQLSALYGCVTPDAKQSLLNSCYIFDAPDCCGCANWNSFGIQVPAATEQCKNTSNPDWNNSVLPKIKWMKETCPSYYTYPYDDESSSFRCSNTAAGSSNGVGYTVTFCPGGNSGLPSGAVEGRG